MPCGNGLSTIPSPLGMVRPLAVEQYSLTARRKYKEVAKSSLIREIQKA